METEIQQSYNVFLEKMCEEIGVNPGSVNPEEVNFFDKHSWSMEQQHRFREWMEQTLMRHPTASVDLIGKSTLTEYDARKLARDFVNKYGWRIE